MVIELPPDAREALLAHAAELEQFGFEVEEFGGDQRPRGRHARAAQPGAGRRRRCARWPRTSKASSGSAPVQEHLRHMAATMACHAAVKANDPLTHEKMAHILDELRATAYSTVCPHGRPVMLRLTRREIEKNFQRI